MVIVNNWPTSSKHVIDCLKSFLVINAWFSGRLTFEPVVVVENCS